MRLLICGNGFDISHGLKTKYSDYKEIGLKNNEKVKNDFEKFPWLSKCEDCDLWMDVEKALTIDVKEIIKYVKDYYYEDGKILDCEFQTDFEELTEFIYFFTGESFYNWLMDVDYSNIEKKDFIEIITKNAFVINFNYTNTLEDIYNVKEENIYHIHGALKNVDYRILQSNHICPSCSTIEEVEARTDEVILSYRFNSDILKSEIQFGSPSISKELLKKELEEAFGEQIVNESNTFIEFENFIEAASKHNELNLPYLKSFLSGKEIDEIVIMGHSLGGLDNIYYEKVLIPLFKDKKWIIFVYGELNTDFAEKYNLKNVEYRNWNNEIIEIPISFEL